MTENEPEKKELPTVPYPANWPDPEKPATPPQWRDQPHLSTPIPPKAVDWSRPLPDNRVPPDIDRRDSNLWFWFVLIMAILIVGFFLARWLGLLATGPSPLVY